jgi:MerR family redox-sensitive transcriptional activator SoxR
MSSASSTLADPSELLSIGEVSRRSGKAPSAIRYYEQLGLISTSERVSGRRRYAADVVRTLAVIETAQRAGLSLEEVRLLLEASAKNVGTEELRRVAERKLPQLREAIERAELVRKWLEDAALCRCPTLDDCELFDPAERLPPTRTLSLG